MTHFLMQELSVRGHLSLSSSRHLLSISISSPACSLSDPSEDDDIMEVECPINTDAGAAQSSPSNCNVALDARSEGLAVPYRQLDADVVYVSGEHQVMHIFLDLAVIKIL